MVMCSTERDSIRSQNPEMRFTEISRTLGERWKSLSEEQKQVYVDKANADKKRYELEMAKYNDSKD